MRLSELIAPAFYGVHADMRAGRHEEYFLKGGRGSAKSSFASVELILFLLRNPDLSCVVYRKYANALRGTVFEQLLWAVERMGLEGLFELRRDPPELSYGATGQRVLFRGADDPGRSKSLKLKRGAFGLVWFEEVAEFSNMADIRSIKASVLRGTDRAVAIYTYNPPANPNHWLNVEALLPRAGRMVHHSDYRSVPKKWLGKSFIAEAEALRAVNERAYRQMYLGEVTGDGGQVFDNLSLRAVSQAELDDAGRPLNGLDFGFAADPDAFVRVWFDARRRRLFVADEFVGVRTPADRLAAEVASRAKGATVRCDSAEPRMIAELRERGVNAVAARKGPGSVREGIRWLQALSEIVIDPARCPHAAREFSAYAYAPDGMGGFCPDCPDRDNHLIDAARYALEELIQRRGARTIRRERLGI